MHIHRLTYPDKDGGESFKWFKELQEIDKFREDLGLEPDECHLKSIRVPESPEELVNRLNVEVISSRLSRLAQRIH